MDIIEQVESGIQHIDAIECCSIIASKNHLLVGGYKTRKISLMVLLINTESSSRKLENIPNMKHSLRVSYLSNLKKQDQKD